MALSLSGGEVKAGPVSAPILPLAILGIGMYLAWFGIHYWARGGWPTAPVKSVLQGKGLPDPGASTQLTNAQLTADVASVTNAQNVAGATEGKPTGSGPSVSGSYDTNTLGQLWVSQGGASSTAFIAANVAMAESSGNAAATSSNPDGGTNVGLWQLDTPGGVGAGYTVEQLKDPATNARITIMHTANGTNWSQWADSVVVNGVYVGPKV